jgi:hypothetical protein
VIRFGFLLRLISRGLPSEFLNLYINFCDGVAPKADPIGAFTDSEVIGEQKGVERLLLTRSAVDVARHIPT